MRVTNPKLRDLVPHWAPFRGVSVLFENPGHSHRPSGALDELQCDLADPAHTLYRALRVGLQALDLPQLTAAYGFCALAPHSYHVTVWDGVNDGNREQVPPAHQPAIDALLADVPGALLRPDPFLDLIRAAPLLTQQWALTFQVAELAIWGETSLVATLQPLTDCQGSFAVLHTQRSALSEAIAAVYGIRPFDPFRPHVTLGYFANPEGARQAVAALPNWQTTIGAQVQGQTITVRTIRLYGFSDMITFLTCSSQQSPQS